MIKNDQLTFKELPPPILNKLFSIAQPEKQLITQHWKNLMSVIEIENNQKQRNTYLVYKCKSNIAFVNFIEGSLLYQRKFKILYGQMHEITCLRFHFINIRFSQTKKKELLIGIGFYDGAFQIYNMIISQKSVILKKLIFLQNHDAIHTPVTGIAFNKKNLFLSRTHNVVIYKDFLSAVANMIIHDQINKDKGKETYYKFAIQNINLENMVYGTSLSISPGLYTLFIYNQTEGAKSIDYQVLKVVGSIVDSLTFVKETYGQNIILGDTCNYLKIIYQGKNYVERYTGFKNYCYAVDHVVFPNHQEIWVGDLNGSVTYFQRYLGVDNKPPNKQLKMVEFNVKYSFNLCQNGIKDLRVGGKLLFILDTESNLHIYDIVRKDALEHLKTRELQSVQEYSNEG